MSLYVLADLHLSLSEKINKPMEVFGKNWENHIERIKKYWSAVVCEEDTVVVPGDISWAMRIEDALEDLKFIDSLPGTKIISKGNHDFWWSTVGKIESFFAENDIKSIKLLHNNAFLLDECVVCGTRGWFYDESQQNVVNETDFNKIVSREAQRLEMSIKAAIDISQGKNLPLVAFFHFPPVWNGFVCTPIIDILHKYNITRCYFGHIHGSYFVPRSTEFEGISMSLVSADYLKFAPMPVFFDDY